MQLHETLDKTAAIAAASEAAMGDGREHRWTDDDEEEESSGRGGRVPDFVRKALMTGLGAVFTTEEGVRSAVGENMKLPKEAISYLMGMADRTKRDLIATMARELRVFLDNLEVDDLARRALAGTTFEIHTTIRITADDDGKLNVKSEDTSLARTDDDDDDDAVEKKPKKKRKSRKKTAKKNDEGDGSDAKAKAKAKAPRKRKS